jgi:hypothetical protein
MKNITYNYLLHFSFKALQTIVQSLEALASIVRTLDGHVVA